MPAGWRLVDLYDVWLGAPALAGQVVAADYRIELGAVRAAGAPARPRGARRPRERFPRERQKGGGTVDYDLRPLLVDVEVVGIGPPVASDARTRFHPVLGTGRPEEVVAALGDRLGERLAGTAVVRERLLLADERTDRRLAGRRAPSMALSRSSPRAGSTRFGR